MKTVKLFWWAPTRSLRLMKPEIESNLTAWMHLGARTGRPFRNFGDEISPLVIERVCGKRVEWASPKTAQIVSVGSVMELAGRYPSSAMVWGTGLRGEPSPEKARQYRENLGQILAVRGPKTRAALSLSDETPLGDPGLLADRLVPRTASMQKRRLFIPHFTTWNSAEGRKLIAKAKARAFEIIPPSLSPTKVMEAISQASFVLSSSLHGVIVAHSLDVPARLLEVGGRPGQEPSWKFVDYFESLDREFEADSWNLFDSAKALSLSIDKANDSRSSITQSVGALSSRLSGALKDALG